MKVYTATESDIIGGEYYGSSRMKETRGYPKIAKKPKAINNGILESNYWEFRKN